jgi:hypothetical protein
MLYAPGSIVAGSSLAIPISRPKPAGHSISIIGALKANRSVRAISSSARTKETSIQARLRRHPTTPTAPAQTMRVEHEYERGGALAYLAAWDAHRARLFGRCEPSTGIKPFGNLVEQVMSAEPYASADRVFWVVDNGSSHRGQSSIDRLQGAFSNLVLIHLPVHASWLNQIEIYFSVVARKVLIPNDFTDLAEVEARLLDFQDHYERIARPFEWKFTRADLSALLAKLQRQSSPSTTEAA